MDPVKLLVLMHLHQPDLRPAGGGRSLLPWVRLHAVRGYLDLAEALARFNHLHWAVSFSGILIEQLTQYSRTYQRRELAPDTWRLLRAGGLALPLREPQIRIKLSVKISSQPGWKRRSGPAAKINWIAVAGADSGSLVAGRRSPQRLRQAGGRRSGPEWVVGS